ncbi:hypothetical protein [Streptomyces sp. NPDC059063]|uniref:hypothetical protein n=1 Tax=unclassified Streptomyces TaxID=2593676 RepID=UPI0036BFCE82
MEMNDTMAATVAAVVPVLWLVAVVEVQQLTRRMLPLDDAVFREMDDVLREIGSGGSDVSSDLAERVETLLTTRAVIAPGHLAVMKRYWVRYSGLAVLLLMLEAGSLLWLISPIQGTAASVMGLFAFVGTMASFCAVLFFPVHFTMEVANEWAQHKKQLTEFLIQRSRRDPGTQP